jgi:hypothetical protein
MNIGPDTFEKTIAASCIQLAQAYSVIEKINIDMAKLKVGSYLMTLNQFFPSKNEGHDMMEFIKEQVSLAIRAADGKPDKAYYELLKLRESLN